MILLNKHDVTTEDALGYLLQFYTNDQLAEHVGNNETKICDLYQACLPQDVKIADLALYPGKLLVESPDGFVPVKSLVKKDKLEILEIQFSDDTVVRASPFHMFETVKHGFLSVCNLSPGMLVKSAIGNVTVSKVTDLEIQDEVYDLSVNHCNHRYYTNGISSHNSGAGKSLFLQNLAVNWATAGLNVVYITLELSEKLTGMRIDSMITGFDTTSVIRNMDEVAIKVVSYKKKYKGNLQLKQLPNGCTSNDIRSFIKEYEIQSGNKVDAILVDYLDLMSPLITVSASNMFVKDKYVSEELRNIAVELDVLMVSASQLNRGSYEEIEFDPSHIAGGISKVHTADNVIGIFTTISMKDAGRYQIQFMKTRSSAGVGSKVDLSFDTKTLRIGDLDPGSETSVTASAKNIMESLKRKSSTSDSVVVDPPKTTSSNATDLRALLRSFD